MRMVKYVPIHLRFAHWTPYGHSIWNLEWTHTFTIFYHTHLIIYKCKPTCASLINTLQASVSCGETSTLFSAFFTLSAIKPSWKRRNIHEKIEIWNKGAHSHFLATEQCLKYCHYFVESGNSKSQTGKTQELLINTNMGKLMKPSCSTPDNNEDAITHDKSINFNHIPIRFWTFTKNKYLYLYI